MPAGDELRADTIGIVEQLAEFQPGVADDARVRRAPGRILVDEVVDDPIELLLEVQGVEGDVQHLGHAAGVVGVGRAAAPCLRVARVVQNAGPRASRRLLVLAVAHEHADDLVALLAQQPGGHAAIDAPRHGQNNTRHRFQPRENHPRIAERRPRLQSIGRQQGVKGAAIGPN